MRIARFFYDGALELGQFYTLDLANSHQILHVLRYKLTQELCLFNNTPYNFSAVITDLKRKTVTVQITTKHPNNLESPLQIHLVQGIIKGQNMDYALHKAVELGVAAITPIITERTVVKLAARSGRWAAQHRQDAGNFSKVSHWQAVVISACAQCGRSIVPKVEEPINFSDWLLGVLERRRVYILAPQAATSIRQIDISVQQISIAVGPEGGFSAAEIALAEQQGCVLIALGPRILRAETASAAVLAALQLQGGDLS